MRFRQGWEHIDAAIGGAEPAENRNIQQAELETKAAHHLTIEFYETHPLQEFIVSTRKFLPLRIWSCEPKSRQSLDEFPPGDGEELSRQLQLAPLRTLWYDPQ
jgi:hypothetical protein